MNLEEQIEFTKTELDAYKENKFSSPLIVDWLESIYETLCRMKDLEK
jgi:hypothetical protein